MASVPELEVRLLGATEVRRCGAPVGIGSTMQRATLAILALAGGRPVPAGELVAGLWGTAAPPSAATTLRAYVSRLRTGILGERLGRSSGGYFLDLPPDALDVTRFEVAASQTGDDVDELAAALALWRGPVLADLRALPFAAPVVTRLEATQATMRERRLALLVAGERAAEAVAELQQLVLIDPHDERLAGLLMQALARTGRHAEALAGYEALRRRLRDDLGLDPGPAVRELHGAILVHDPAIVGGVATPAVATRDDVTVRTAPPAAGNLPLPRSAFVGRGEDIHVVHALLDTARLVTLTGAGGCGKTRLAIEAMRQLPAPESDGPWLVELAGLEDGALVATAVAQTLGVTTATAARTLDAVVAALHGRRTLLVLDNCEHLVEDVALFVDRFLASCPGVRILATSREALGVPGERLHGVASLPLGRPDRPGDAELLFVDRARALVPTFDLDDVTGPMVRRICAALDGIPLALELAAARLRVLSLESLAEGLDDRFALLTQGSRTALPRHRTLAAAIEWSHDLLGDDERAVFAAASVFRTSFELEDLAVVHGCRPAALVPLLGALVDKSMVVTDLSITGTRRYRLLETLRAFGQDRLTEDERQRLQDAHATRFSVGAEDAAARLRSFDDAPAWRWIDAARPDLRAALEHATATGSELAPRLVGALGWYWYRRGFVREGLLWSARVAPLLSDADPRVAAQVRLGEISLRYLAGDVEGLRAEVPGLAAAVDAADDPTLRMVARIYLGYFEAGFGEAARAEQHLRTAAEIAASGAPADWARAEVAMTQGQFLRALGRPAEAVEVLRAGQELAAACGHRWGAGSIGWICAKAHLDMGDTASAATLLGAVFAGFRAQGDRTSTLAAVHTMAAVAAGLERHADGARLFGAVDALGERIGFSVQAMDPADSQAHRARVAVALMPEEFAAAYEEGRHMGLDEVTALIDRLTP